MRKRSSRFTVLFVLISLVLAVGIAYAAIVRERTTNPTMVSGQPDGIEPGGDRHNSYAWAMGTLTQAGDDYLYVGGNRDLIYSILRLGGLSNDTIATIFQGDIATPAFQSTDPRTNDGRGRVFRYKLDGTGSWEKMYTSQGWLLTITSRDPLTTAWVNSGNYAYRGAVNFTDSNEETALYMVTTQNPGRVLKFPENFKNGDIPVEVFRIIAQSGMGALEGPLRGMTIHNGELYISTFNNHIYKTSLPQEQGALNPATPATYNATAGWTRVDGGNIPASSGSIWQILSFNGYLYAFLAGEGFQVYKGMPNGTSGDWQVIVGPDGKYLLPGMGDIYNCNNATATKVFNGYVYVGTMTETHLSFIAGTFSADRIKGAQMYRFDANDNWELVIGDVARNPYFTTRRGNYGAGFFNQNLQQMLAGYDMSFNQYIWWMEEHQGKLYATTFDFSVFLKYINRDLLAGMGYTEEEITDILNRMSQLEQVKDNPAGFDLYVSSDGLNWSPVTIDGFGDQYNYGGRTMLSTAEGLFLGTANPFWGSQVWKLEDTGSGGGGGGGGCFIATAAFGSPLSGQVMVLREFRDRFLLTNALGRAFVSWYYENSPAASSWIGQHPAARQMVRVALYPVIGMAWAANHAPYVLLIFMLLGAGLLVYRRILLLRAKIK